MHLVTDGRAADQLTTDRRAREAPWMEESAA
ncbi:uncharacterized protein SOCE26_016510 [Sorangium cellulosum]|uniref:Uncharacterized protein n=1 Tax=Sorangium cellulosum TaxID=56 RepID=A0A2L0ELW5_SORCE|nr:uncharacterized protein SOCE26_016510 [Sorangium cellulosum]